MARNDNLIPINERSENEQREISKKGGKASGKARRKKRDIKNAVTFLLSLPVTDNDEIKALEDFGVSERDQTNMMMMLVQHLKQAKAGDVRSAEFIVNSSGDAPKYKIQEKRLEIMEESMHKVGSIVDDWVDSIPETSENVEEKAENHT